MRALVSQRMVRVFECIRMRSQVPRMRILCASARAVPALECQPACSASLALDGVASTFCFPRFFAASRWPRVVETGVGTLHPYSCLQLPTEFFQRCHPSLDLFLPLQIEQSHKSFLQGAGFVGGQFVGWLKPVMHKKRGGALGEGTGRKFPRKNNTCRTRGET